MNIVLVCNAGMSTGMLAKKMEAASGGKYSVKAYGIAEYMEHLENVDLILVGPQIRFQSDEIRKNSGNIPVMDIAPMDYGCMNADAILKKIHNAMGGVK